MPRSTPLPLSHPRLQPISAILACSLLGGSLLGGSLLGCSEPAYIEPTDETLPLLSHPPALFDPSPTGVILWARAEKKGKYYAEIIQVSAPPPSSSTPTSPSPPPLNFNGARKTPPVTATKETDLTISLPIEGLTPHQTYALRLRSVEHPELKVPPRLYRAGRPEGLRLAWTADLFSERRPFKLFDHIRAARPDVLALLGDTAYADYPPRPSKRLSDLRWHHRHHRGDPHLSAALAALPTLATWDDHEVANNFDQTHPLAAHGRRAFLEYWPARLTRPQAEGMYRSAAWGGLAEVFLLDTRSQRSAPSHTQPAPTAPPPARTLLGEAQGRWLREGLKRSRAAFKLILSSVPLGLSGWPDTWDGFPQERAALLEWIRAEGVEGVVFLTGDLHLACDASSPSHTEVIAGPAGAWTFKELFPHRLAELKAQGRWHLADALNFGIADLQRVGEEVSLTLTIRDQTGAEHLIKRLRRPHPTGVIQ